MPSSVDDKETTAMMPGEDGSFRVARTREEERLCVRMRGHADVGAKATLDGIVAEVDKEATADAVQEVVVDLRRLDFMNSSCLKTLVTWLNNVRQRPAEQQYRIRFLRDVNAYWQERSLATLQAFAPAIVTVE